MNYGFVCPGGARPFDFAARQAFVDIAAHKGADLVAPYNCEDFRARGDLSRNEQFFRARCIDNLKKSGASQEELVFLDLLWQDTFAARLKARAKP